MGFKSRLKQQKRSEIKVRFIRPGELRDAMDSLYQSMVIKSTGNDMDRRVMRFVEMTRGDIVAQGLASFTPTIDDRGYRNVKVQILSTDPNAEHFQSKKDLNDMARIVGLMQLKEYSLETIHEAEFDSTTCVEL